MKRLRQFILLFGLLAVVYFNVREGLSHFHKGVQHPVGGNAVSVYKVDPISKSPAVPVLDFVGNQFVETGQSVNVYLKYSYEEREIRLTRVVLLTTSITFLLYILTFVIGRFLPKPA